MLLMVFFKIKIALFLPLSSDFLVVSYHFRLVGDTFTLIHHLMAIVAYYFVMVRNIIGPFIREV